MGKVYDYPETIIKFYLIIDPSLYNNWSLLNTLPLLLQMQDAIINY